MLSTVVPPDFYATASGLFDYTNTSATLKNATLNAQDPPPKATIDSTVYIYGIVLILIPTATILGNLLVIVSVLRFKSLHSAINFLILGLAVADLFVALFVMPYAVYIHVQGGYWFLGPLMCDIYSASDVACSTASILLLAVISFDRYRAVSRPIQYSRQSQNIKRVVVILIAIWFISLALASPIVLGVNNRPPDASPYECRFYNAEFSIMSSIVSFVIPCFIVLFVYIRIMMALRKREKAAKMRRQANQLESGKKEEFDGEEAGQIVAGPAVNVMMLALPSMTRRIRRYERHKAAVENAGEEEESENEGVSGDEEDEEDFDEDDEEVFEDESEADLLEFPNTDESAVDSGIGQMKKKRSSHGKRRNRRRRRNRSSGADSLAAAAITASNAAKGKSSATPQALCLSSFLPILGTATASIREPRKTSLVSPRKLLLQGLIQGDQPKSAPVTARLECVTETSPTINTILNNNSNNLSVNPSIKPSTNREAIWEARAKFFRSTSGPSVLDARSPLMLRRFVLDSDNDPEILHLDVKALEGPKRGRSCDLETLKNDHYLAGSCTPRSSTDSLSENVNVVTNDFVSEGPTSMSRRSSDFDSSFANNTVSSINSSNMIDRSDRSSASEFKKSKLKNSIYFHRRSLTMPAVDSMCKNKRENHSVKEPFLPAFLRTISKRSPKIFRVAPNSVSVTENSTFKRNCSPQLMNAKSIDEDDTIIENSAMDTMRKIDQGTEDETDRLLLSSAETETLSATQITVQSRETPSPTNFNPTIIRRTPLNSTSNAEENRRSIQDCSLATTAASAKIGGLIIENESASTETPKHISLENKRLQKVQNKEECGSPSVSFNIEGKTFFGGGRGQSTSSAPVASRRRSSFIEVGSDSKPSGSSGGLPSSISSNVISSESTGPLPKNKVFVTKSKPKHSNSKHSMDSNPSVSSTNKTLEQKRKLLNNSKLNGSSTALAVRIVKRTINRKESSLKRKVTKAQRKEKRATKTLGIVVGIFLICWVPFFTINILNAVCILIDQPSCQVGFNPFFFSTWIGYMNSFMNPVIYTIFNTEFRKAFKSLICGRDVTRRHRARHV